MSMNEAQPTLSAAMDLIRSRSPLMLNQATTAQDGVEHTFAADHEFTISLPAWVFRALASDST